MNIDKSTLISEFRTGLQYYGNCHFIKRDLGISIKISSVFGVSNLFLRRENLSFTNGNPGFEEKIDNISAYINIIYHGL